jgi:hypothetical protein
MKTSSSIAENAAKSLKELQKNLEKITNDRIEVVEKEKENRKKAFAKAREGTPLNEHNR